MFSDLTNPQRPGNGVSIGSLVPLNPNFSATQPAVPALTFAPLKKEGLSMLPRFHGEPLSLINPNVTAVLPRVPTAVIAPLPSLPGLPPSVPDENSTWGMWYPGPLAASVSSASHTPAVDIGRTTGRKGTRGLTEVEQLSVQKRQRTGIPHPPG